MRKSTGLVYILFLLTFFACDTQKEKIEFPKNLILSETINSGCTEMKSISVQMENGFFEYIQSKNSIEIKHWRIYEHCNAQWLFEIDFTEENKIIIKEIDNSEFRARCYCYFNISTTIENIVPGLEYEIEIWNEEMTELLDSQVIYIN